MMDQMRLGKPIKLKTCILAKTPKPGPPPPQTPDDLKETIIKPGLVTIQGSVKWVPFFSEQSWEYHKKEAQKRLYNAVGNSLNFNGPAFVAIKESHETDGKDPVYVITAELHR
jgi:hypothetical protein